MKHFVAMSGGVDSTALALAMPDAELLFTDTGDEFDEVLEHIAKFESVTGRKVTRIDKATIDGVEYTLPEYEIKAKFFPNHGARYCTRLFKLVPMNKYLQEQLPATLNIGLRADEPEDTRTGNLTDMDGLHIRYPMREWGWTRADALKTCIQHDLLPRYAPYMARGGCKGCFYKRKSEVVALCHLRPDIAQELIAREQTVQDGREEYFYMFANIKQPVSEIFDAVQRQSLMFTLEEVYANAADHSDKGQVCGLFCNR